MKKLMYDNHINNKEELIRQLKSLKQEAFYMMRSPINERDIFVKDFHALSIVISFLMEDKIK